MDDANYILGQVFVRKYDIILFHDLETVTTEENAAEQRFYTTVFIQQPEPVEDIWFNFIAYNIAIVFIIILVVWLYQKKTKRYATEMDIYIHIEKTLRDAEENDAANVDAKSKQDINKKRKQEIKNIIDMRLDTGVRHRYQYLQQRDFQKTDDAAALSKSTMNKSIHFIDRPSAQSVRSDRDLQPNSQSVHRPADDTGADHYRLSVTTGGQNASMRGFQNLGDQTSLYYK